MENEKKLSINYSKKVLNHLDEFQSFMPTDMIRVYHSKLDDFIFDKMSTSIKRSADVFVDDKKLEKWAKMCMALENMTKEEIENIAVRHYVEKLENEMNNKLAKYEKAFEILKEELNIDLGKEEYTFKDFKDIYYYMSIRPVWQDTKTTFELSQNEHELLEELMKDEK